MSALPEAWQPRRTPPTEVVIGASQISTILGIDRFQTAEQLYRRMRGLEPYEPENPDMARGKHLEAGLCSWWCELAKATRAEALYARCGQVLGNGQLQVRHPEQSWARATADIVAEATAVDGNKGLLAVDTKCPRSDGKKTEGGAWVKTWHQPTQTAPRSYVAQSVFQQGVLRAAGVPVTSGELAAGPLWGDLIRVAVAFDAEFFALMLERASIFRDCVMSGAPLPADFTQENQ